MCRSMQFAPSCSLTQSLTPFSYVSPENKITRKTTATMQEKAQCVVWPAEKK